MIKRVIFVVAMICSLVVWGGISSKASAEVQTVEADGYYIIGDGPDENYSVAKERARQDAKRTAAEKTGVFVESLSVVKNGQLTKDEILTITTQILKIESEKITPEVIGETIRYHCHIVAKVDSSNITEELLNNRKKLYEAVKENKRLLEELNNNRRYPYFGASIMDKEGALRCGYKLNIDNGVYVFKTVKNSPASKAGMQSGDVILKINDIPVNTYYELLGAVVYHKIGDVLILEVERRDGSKKLLKVVLEALPTN